MYPIVAAADTTERVHRDVYISTRLAASPTSALDARLRKLERHLEHRALRRSRAVRQAEAFEFVERQCLNFAACELRSAPGDKSDIRLLTERLEQWVDSARVGQLPGGRGEVPTYFATDMLRSFAISVVSVA